MGYDWMSIIFQHCYSCDLHTSSIGVVKLRFSSDLTRFFLHKQYEGPIGKCWQEWCLILLDKDKFRPKIINVNRISNI